MSEVMISRRSSGSGGSGGGNSLKTEYITFNRNWTVPDRVKNNYFYIRIFGAGAHASYNAGGGSGWMNNDNLVLTPGAVIPISIGITAGSSTSFGSYLLANGGYSTSGGAGGGTNEYSGGRGYQFGGGGAGTGSITASNIGGDGGPWGGGGGGAAGKGGNGGTYGGGGGGDGGGNGGTYGGGGGGHFYRYGRTPSSFPSYGIGGTYGGNGGNIIKDSWYNQIQTTNAVKVSESGTNTIAWTNVAKDDITGEYFRGHGMAWPSSYCSGGGGFGGNGGTGGVYMRNYTWYTISGGGGGGYGSKGGTGSNYLPSGGGGGGYGGDGGDATTNYSGGGGGYGKVSKGASGGGGYYHPAGDGSNNAKGGGGIGIWDNGVMIASFGSGSSTYNPSTPEQGICIIQYYA